MTVKRFAKDALLGLAGAAGLACILCLIASALFGASLVVFRTGSMAPSMPTGTLAVALPVDAADIAVGDVLMVERDEQLPVTHRVVEITPDPRDENGVVVLLKGDANGSADREPYHLTEAMRIVFPIPGLGTAFMVARTPLFLGAATLLVAALVVWAFWPSSRDGEQEQEQEQAQSGQDESEGDPMDDQTTDRFAEVTR